MEEKIERLIKWSKGGKAPPLTLELNITNKCNLLCKMCWLRSTNPNYDEEMKDEELARIIDEAIELGVKEFRFPGSGEPLMRKEILFKLMKKIKERGGNGLLISNGTLFSEEDVKKMIEMKWDVLTISLDGPSPEINDYIRGVEGAFEGVVKTLNLIKKWKKKLREEYPWLRMNVVLTNKNYNKLEEIVMLASEFGFKEVLLQPMTIFSKEGEKLRIKNVESISDYLKAAERRAREFDIKTNFSSFIKSIIVERTNEMKKMIKEEIRKFDDEFLCVPCYEPFYNLVIMPNGKVGSCAISGGKTEVDVKNNSLKEVWFGPFFDEVRKNLLKGKLFPFCSHCCVPIFLENKKLRSELAKVIE
ncbi:MAG: radical SAM protein [Candidatus Aenigmatarchaeota archaeon]